ncbi:DegT/DnrJ/EryC1/StrS family aminotransferase [Pseudomonadota bacterium]
MNTPVIPLFKVAMSESANEAVARVLASGMVGEGPQVARFQQELAKLFDHKHVIPLSSCTGSLALALRLAGVGPGDDVISSPFTMVATSSAIKQAGGTIAWCDVELSTLCADVHDIKHIVRPGVTKAIIITCVGGLMPHHFEQLAEFEIPIILDCAHALTTTFKGKHISHWADFCCFSFQAIKQLTTGDGGALTTKDKQAWKRAETLKWFGLSRTVPEGMTRLEHQMKADVREWGYKYHLNDIAATIGLSNIELALRNIQTTQSNSQEYLQSLKDIEGISTLTPPATCNPSWWLFGLLARDRDNLIDYLAQEGIMASPMWARNDGYTAFKEQGARRLPNLEKVMSDVVFIPNGWWLTEVDRNKVISTIKNFY